MSAVRREVRCDCGQITGVGCVWVNGREADLVTVEYMPDHLRASHEAAGNRGRYPHNGALRLRVTPECAASTIEASDGWAEQVSP